MRQRQTGSEQHTGRRGAAGDVATAMTEELRGALATHGIALPSLGLDPLTHASGRPDPLVSLGNCNLDTARRLAAVLRGFQGGAPGEAASCEAATYEGSAYVREALTVRLFAEPAAVGELRRRVRSLLAGWGLPQHADTAQLCVSELATNVVTHVGEGVPVTLRVSLAGDRPRIELTDPDARALPTLIAATDDAESGRGLALLDALTLRWGVTPHADGKTTWCELAP